MTELTLPHPDAATTIFNLEDYPVLDTQILASGHRRIQVESTVESGCPECGGIGTRRHSRRWQRVRDIPVAGAVEVLWAKQRYFCDEELCGRRTFSEATVQVPRTAVSVDHFHLIQLANQALTEVRQQLSQQVRGRRGRAVDPHVGASYAASAGR